MALQRRQFIAALGGAAVAPALPRVGHAQQPKTVIGYLHSASPGPFQRFLAAFKAGLKDGGFVEGENLEIEYRWAEGESDRLPAMAADLVRRGVSAIVTGGAERPVLAAKAASVTTPLVFVMGGDPVRLGIVPSLARPSGNITGITMFTSALESKRLGLLHEVLPKAQTVGVLLDPSRAVAQTQLAEVNAAVVQTGVKPVIVHATTQADFDGAFARIVAQGAGALLVCANPFFMSQRRQIVALAAHHRMPAMYEWRDFPEAGGLMSYGTDLAAAYRQSGIYAARILKGAKPADLPIMQATRFEFVINLATARILGIEIAPTVLARADEVIE
jgi:putative ABC transport system substrate-binding protein